MSELDPKNITRPLGVLLNIVPSTLSIILVCAGLGYLIDKWLDSSPIALIAGLVIAFPTIQYNAYKQAKSLIDKKSKND